MAEDQAIIMVLLLVVIMTGALVVIGYFVYRAQYGEGAKFKKRMDLVIGTSVKKEADAAKAGAGRKKAIQAKLKDLEQKQQDKRKGQGLPEKILQSGMQVTPKQFYIYSALFGVFCCVFYMLKGYNPVGLPFVLIATGLGLPRWFLGFKIKRRQKKFTLQFGDAMDVIVRGIRTGLPVGECLNMIGKEMSDPVGLEFRYITEGQKIGLTLMEVLERGLERMPTPEFNFFSIVMNIQQQTGGNLADTLDKLSGVLRERRKLRDKIQALSSEAKSSAGIIGSLPFIVCGLLYLVNPDYMVLLFTNSLGHILIAGGLIWMSLGVLVMWRMINFDF